MRTTPGAPHPLGASCDERGAHFAIFSAHATRVELCLFEPGVGAPGGLRETHRIALPERTGDVWHVGLPDVGPGRLYGYRVHGPWAPHDGHRFNPHKLLVDPYAQALHGHVQWSGALLGHDPADPTRMNEADSAAYMPRCVLMPAWQSSSERANRPEVPWSRSLLYECHVKGMTRRHPEVRAAWRGRFLGMTEPAVLDHLQALGVTAVELLPIAHTSIDAHLAGLGLTNYWGYSTLGFFAPDARFATAGDGVQVAEFRALVQALHERGIEVLLDVVFNHSPEGGHLGPTLSLRGIDNASYYRLQDGDRSQYADFTGCGNTLDASKPVVRQLVLDCLRHWASVYGVDGFRFDLATALGRDQPDFDGQAPFFELVAQDPLLSRLKLVAEPWDLGPGGYRLGGFPVGWSEWNDRYRTVARRFWRGDAGQLGEWAGRVTGSRDLVGDRGRSAQASINYFCSHDGFTLEDLVSYAHKHNEANGENGADGPVDDSHNWGVEGPTRSRRVLRSRTRAKRNLTAMLAISHGVPMWLGGDEIGRTQRGNNNAYCLDDETSWFDWDLRREDRAFMAFVRHCFEVRSRNAVFRRRRHLDESVGDRVVWHRRDGAVMRTEDWLDPEQRCIGLWLDASLADPLDENGRPQAARSALVLVNGDAHTRRFELPRMVRRGRWIEAVHTACEGPERIIKSDHVRLASHSLSVLEWEPDEPGAAGGRA